jgi:hypothetical protein
MHIDLDPMPTKKKGPEMGMRHNFPNISKSTPDL